VREGYVSAEAARRDYGVHVNGGRTNGGRVDGS